MILKFKKLHPDAKIPSRAYGRAAGFDLFPLVCGTIWPGEIAKLRLGFASEFSDGYVGVIDDRGSTGKAGLTHLAGVIDADYRGEWVVLMKNLGSPAYEYSPDKAIAQVLFLKVEAPEPVEVDELAETARQDNGFGSSDKVSK